MTTEGLVGLMSQPERRTIIRKLQEQRGSHIICYLTSTRAGIEVSMAMDVLRLFYEHLRQIPGAHTEKIDLVLHSNGGESVAPWRLITLLREFCDFLGVIVPHRAFSAATLAALGANEIVMHPLAMLGPIDPTTANVFNPRDPSNPQQALGISVEDVSAYIALVKDDVGITHEDELVEAFNILAQKVHPLALGNVKRITEQSRMMARKLLGLHMDRSTEEHKINQIVEALSSRLYYHGHPINRTEAKDDLDLKVIEPAQDVEDTVWELYQQYESAMLLGEPFVSYQEFLAGNPDLSTPGKIQRVDRPAVTLAYVESESMTHRNVLEYELVGSRGQDGITRVQLTKRREGWEQEPEDKP